MLLYLLKYAICNNLLQFKNLIHLEYSLKEMGFKLFNPLIYLSGPPLTWVLLIAQYHLCFFLLTFWLISSSLSFLKVILVSFVSLLFVCLTLPIIKLETMIFKIYPIEIKITISLWDPILLKEQNLPWVFVYD